jgi:hypothetical protein
MTYRKAFIGALMDVTDIILAIVVICVLAAFFSSSALAQDSWTCYVSGNQRICYGWQGGRYMTCTTTYFGNQSSTHCY